MANAKVAIFVDGKNFYEGLRASGLTNKIDFKAMSDYVVKKIHGSVLTGLHYFTGIEPINQNESDEEDKDQKKSGLNGFLSFLETQPGCFVYRFPRRVRRGNCENCGHEHVYTEEKAVDTSLVATMIRQAAIDAFDSAVLCSGDADHTPALEALRDLGKPTWVATFASHGLSRRLRQYAYGHIDLSLSHDKYAETDDEDKPDEEYDVVAAVKEAEVYFGNDNERYVGFNMFTKDWRSDNLPKSFERRKQLIQNAIDAGEIERYEAKDGCKAIRTVSTE